MDFLPTMARLAGADVPTDRIIDGKDIWPLISGQPGAKSPHEAFFYYWGERLEAVRSGKWKLHLGHEYNHPDPPGSRGKPGKMSKRQIGVELFDLDNDLSETTNVAEKYPTVVQRLQALAEKCREDLGDSAVKRVGKNVRPASAVGLRSASNQ
jgi:arylsulfatase A